MGKKGVWYLSKKIMYSLVSSLVLLMAIGAIVNAATSEDMMDIEFTKEKTEIKQLEDENEA
ncbi:hypothetical protein [Pontibacillus yanchengensis]|uniref:hypothetical protein n=1 Tax=Pontibacillus yanchengensis TaxID=462910 RepID=UPI00136A4C5E|nr:hypothetical protein [Pontibacillus yanchengensis]